MEWAQGRAMASLGRTGSWGPPRVTPELNKKMWINLKRTVDKRGRTAKKGNHFANGDG